MTETRKVTVVSGSLHEPSRVTVLGEAIAAEIGRLAPSTVTTVKVDEVGTAFGGVLRRKELPASASTALAAIENADVLVVVTPVYRATYTGLLKHIFDFVDQSALDSVPVIVGAVGGDQQHSLIIEHQLKPLFAFFGAATLPRGVYAADVDFVDRQPTEELRARIARAVGSGSL